MERRFLTKPLWAAAVVMIAVGAYGSGVFAQLKLSPQQGDPISLTVACDEDVVVGDVMLLYKEGELGVVKDVHTGEDCFAVIRDFVALVGGGKPHKLATDGVGRATYVFI